LTVFFFSSKLVNDFGLYEYFPVAQKLMQPSVFKIIKKNFLSQGLSEIHAKENQTKTKNGQSNRETGNMGYKTQNGDKQIETRHRN
jgi:hypothetical protein